MNAAQPPRLGPRTTPADQFRKLVLQIGREADNRRGWKAELARKLEVHPSYISKVVAGEAREIGGDVISRACRAFDLDGSWFFDPNSDAQAEDADFRSHTVAALERRRADDYVKRRLRDPSEEDTTATERSIKLFFRLQTLQLSALLAQMPDFASVQDSRYVRPKARVDYALGLAREILDLPFVAGARALLEAPPEAHHTREFYKATLSVVAELGAVITPAISHLIALEEVQDAVKARDPEFSAHQQDILASLQAVTASAHEHGKSSAEKLGLVKDSTR